MSDQPAPNLDPMRAWRDWFVSVEQQWSESLTTLMKDQRVAQSMGKDFQATLQQHQMFAEAMGQYLGTVNLPSRDDVLKLGERIGRIEDGLAALQAELVQLRGALGQAGSREGSAAAASPPRTRRPPQQV